MGQIHSLEFLKIYRQELPTTTSLILFLNFSEEEMLKCYDSAYKYTRLFLCHACLSKKSEEIVPLLPFLLILCLLHIFLLS